MAIQFPLGTTYFELSDVPYARTKEGAIFNCAFEPPRKINDFRRMGGSRISKEVFERMRAVFSAAHAEV